MFAAARCVADDAGAKPCPARGVLISTHRLPLAALALVVVGYYIPQLATGTLQFDGVDVHYSAQRYLSDEIHAGRLPFWTPYLFSGFPFLADLQVGAWYPLNWPFFLAGITPSSLSLELLVHTLVACAGAYALAFRLLGARVPAVGAAVFYGLSGYFAAHSQHVGMSQAAAWLPWLVLYLLRAADGLSPRLLAMCGLLGAGLALPGSFQVALYAFCGAGLWALAETRSILALRRTLIALVAVGVWGALLAAVMLLPALELVSQSIRAGFDARSVDLGYFHPAALVTLVWPDYYGLLSGAYRGPGDSTQHYFYAGVLLLPLAAIGARNVPVLRMAALLGLPFLWYALGPSGGLFRVLVRLPGFASVELPMHGWFLPALGLALLAGAGLARLSRPRLATVGILFTCLDVLAFNQLRNPLAFAREPFDALYGVPLRAFAEQVSAATPAVLRVYGAPLAAVGYRNHALQSRVPVTYGYNPLELRGYAAYAEAAEADPRLLDGFAANYRLDATNALALQPGAPPLATLVGDPAASATLVQWDSDRLVIRFMAVQPGLLRVAVAWYPGWTATLDGSALPIETVDGAFIGIWVPPGQGEIHLAYAPRWFWLGATLSLVSLALAGVCLLLGNRWHNRL